MRKSDLVERLVRRYPTLTRKDVEASVALILEQIRQRLISGGRFELRDFGVLSTHVQPGRMARNPRTGQPVFMSPRRVVRFKPGKKLRLWGTSGVPTEINPRCQPATITGRQPCSGLTKESERAGDVLTTVNV